MATCGYDIFYALFCSSQDSKLRQFLLLNPFGSLAKSNREQNQRNQDP